MIQLPKLFEEKLSAKPSLLGDVNTTLACFEPWLEQSGMPFFPGFTDHSPRHIKDVLNTAAALISDQGHELISPEDIAVLVIAILLHDSGMHLTQDGFRALISDNSNSPKNTFRDQPWKTLWINFLGEARRFGEDKLIAIFGDPKPIDPESINLHNLSENDCLLIGEFVRRHHARLAHEIALSGVPTTGENRLKIHGLDDEIKDIAGLVARSHGMNIRDTFSYLEQNYFQISEYRRIKAPFLMAIIRIADYIQVQSERALKSLLSVKELRSPISQQEWRNHFAVRDVSLNESDPEALYVNARPKDAKTFIRLKQLFQDIQKELDSTWATLGEVYGRHNRLSDLGLTVRRIKSTLDDHEKFSRTVSYIPIAAGFKSSGPDLLKLLVGPLYDYDYSVSIRELIQNATDACKELFDILEITQTNNTADVIVSIHVNDDGTGWVRVVDHGVGMTLPTIVNYFLVAGASFRNSEAWKREHVADDGEIQVIRGGRFGVGALAAFMIGNEITVKTRHHLQPESEGIEFTARIDDPNIELRRTPLPQGTDILIKIDDPDVLAVLSPSIGISEDFTEGKITSWHSIDWFAQTSPRVEYQWSGLIEDTFTKAKIRVSAKFSPSKHLAPNNQDSDPSRDGWNDIPDAAPYSRISWKYIISDSISNEDSSAHIIAQQSIINGIRIRRPLHDYYHEESYLALDRKSSWTSPNFRVRRPSLSITDPLGVCPINLQRSAITYEKMNIDQKIGDQIFTKYIQYLQQNIPPELTVENCIHASHIAKQFPGVSLANKASPYLWITTNGYILPSESIIAKLAISRVYFVRTSNTTSPPTKIKDLISKNEAICFAPLIPGEQATLSWFRSLFGDSASQSYRLIENGFPVLLHDEDTALLPNKVWELVKRPGKVSSSILDRLQIETTEYGAQISSLHFSKPQKTFDQLKKIKENFEKDSLVASWRIERDKSFLESGQPLGDSRITINSIVKLWTEENGGVYLHPRAEINQNNRDPQ